MLTRWIAMKGEGRKAEHIGKKFLGGKNLKKKRYSDPNPY